MTVNDPALRRYYRAVRSWLPSSRKLKKQVMAQLRESVACYLEQEPDADFPQIRARFGEPQAIAAAYVDNADTAELLRTLRIRRKIVTTVTAAAAVILVIWVCIIAWASFKEYKNDQNRNYIISDLPLDYVPSILRPNSLPALEITKEIK